jgi:hypothetical protein
MLAVRVRNTDTIIVVLEVPPDVRPEFLQFLGKRVGGDLRVGALPDVADHPRLWIEQVPDGGRDGVPKALGKVEAMPAGVRLGDL